MYVFTSHRVAGIRRPSKEYDRLSCCSFARCPTFIELRLLPPRANRPANEMGTIDSSVITAKQKGNRTLQPSVAEERESVLSSSFWRLNGAASWKVRRNKSSPVESVVLAAKALTVQSRSTWHHQWVKRWCIRDGCSTINANLSESRETTSAQQDKLHVYVLYIIMHIESHIQ